MQQEDYEEIVEQDTGISANALHLRLNTDAFLDRAEKVIRGKQEILERTNDGRIVKRTLKLGEPRANAVGVQNIMDKLSVVINPQCVQGNFSDIERMDDWQIRFEVDTMEEIMINMNKWGIKETDVQSIFNNIKNPVNLFTTRLLDNLERESYGKTMRITENNRSYDEEGRGKRGLFSK